MQKITIICICLFFTFICFGQQPMHVTFDESKNLPNKTIYDVVEDNNQLIWLATEVGIYKYNGDTFSFYSHPKQIGLSVFNLVLDNSNTIWYNNLANQLFCISNENKPELFLNLNSTFKGENTKITLKNNWIIVSGLNQFIVINKNTKEIEYSYKFSNSIIKTKPFFINNVLNIVLDNNSLLELNLNTFNQTIRKPTTLNNSPGSKSTATTPLSKTETLVTLNLKNKTLQLFINEKGITPYKFSGELLKKRIISSSYIDNELWFSSEDGLYIYSVKNNKITQKHHFFKGITITKTIKDTFDNYWLTTLNNGIYIIPNIALKKLDISSIDTNIKFHFNTSNSFLLSDLKNKLYKFNSNSNKIEAINKPLKHDIKYVFKNPYNNLLHINTLEDGITTYSHDSKLINKKKYQSVIKEINFINDSTYIQSSNTVFGIYKISKQTNTFSNRIFEKKGRSYANTYNKNTKTAYFANINGLYQLTKTSELEEIVSNNDKIFAKKLVLDNDNTLWALKFKNGLIGIKDNNIIKEINTKNSLLSSINHHIYHYKNHIWILGNKGINVYNIKTQEIEKITKDDGLPSYDFKGIFIKNDIAYISTSSSLFYFNINAFKKNKPIIKPYLTNLTVNDVKAPIGDKLEFSSETQKIEFSFNTNGLFSNQNTNYQYKLNNENWENLALGTKTVSFNRISHGNYNLELRALQGQNISEAIKIDFIIKTPFYKHWLFFVSVIILISISIWLIYYRNTKRIKATEQLKFEKKSQELENINLKLENLRSQMNPHFIFNALNSIQDYILKNETTLARHFLVKFSRLIRIYLEHSQANLINLKEELEALTLYLDLEKDRFGSDFNYTINKGLSLNVLQIKLSPFLLQPYVENAIKHGLLHKKGQKQLTINFELIDSVLECTIIDNGIGREKSHVINSKLNRHKSFSTNANKKRIELLQKAGYTDVKIIITDIKDKSNALGTKVVLKIPQQLYNR